MLIAANLTLDRFRWRSSDQRVTLNRSGSGTMSSYFGTGQPGRTQFVFIAVADSEDHIAEIDIGAEFGVASTSTLRLDTIPAAAQALLNLVQPEGVINLVIGDEGLAPDDIALSARAGDPTVTVDLEAVTPAIPLDVGLSARAGNPTVALNLEAVAAPIALDVAVEARAGEPAAAFSLDAVAAPLALDVAVLARAGDPTATVNLEAGDAPTSSRRCT